MFFWKPRFNFRTHIWTWWISKLWKSLDILASYPFLEIEIEPECDPEPHVSLFGSIMTPVSLPDFFSIPESTLNPVPVHREMESPISYNHIHCWGKCVNINSLVWTLFLNQFRLSLLTLDLIWVKFSSRCRFFLLFHLSPNYSSSKITHHYWTRLLTKMTK